MKADDSKATTGEAYHPAHGSASWSWSSERGILDASGNQMIQIVQTHGKTARIREGKIITALLNAHCVPNKNGRPVLPNTPGQPPLARKET